jgi:hypothetical protein
MRTLLEFFPTNYKRREAQLDRKLRRGFEGQLPVSDGLWTVSLPRNA